MIRVIGIDPGSEHCGVVVIDATPKEHLDEMPWYTTEILITEFTPLELYDFLEAEKGTDVYIAYEAFHLYPWQAQRRAFSTFPEAEVIGTLKYICVQKFTEANILAVKPGDHKHFRPGFIRSRIHTIKNSHIRDAYSVAIWVLAFKLLPTNLMENGEVDKDLSKIYIHTK